MKKIITMAIAMMAVVTLVSCGASPQNRQGFNSAVDKATEGMTQLTGSAGYVYTIGEALKSNAELEARGIKLEGLLGSYHASRVVTSFSMALAIDQAGTIALLTMDIEFADDPGVVNELTIPSVGTVVHKNGMMQINLADSFGTIALTGTSSNGISSVVNIRDAGMPVPFAQNTIFTLLSSPTAAGNATGRM